MQLPTIPPPLNLAQIALSLAAVELFLSAISLSSYLAIRLISRTSQWSTGFLIAFTLPVPHLQGNLIVIVKSTPLSRIQGLVNKGLLACTKRENIIILMIAKMQQP